MSKILIISNEAEDAHVHGLVAELDTLGHAWTLIDPGDFPQSLPFSAQLDGQTKESSLLLKDGTRLFLEEITSVWYRRPTPIAPAEHLSPLEKTFIEREANAGLWGWLRGLQAFFVNHPDAIRAAGHKPHQLQLAQTLGLATPKTLITNEPEAFKRFYTECHEQVIYKLMGYPWYKDSTDLPISTFTTLVPREMVEQAHRISATAHLFQEFIEKRCDLRAIIIGNEVFLTEIYPLSDATRVDFRTDYNALRYAPHDRLPDTVREALLSINRSYHLAYSAIDLLYTPDGRYVFLELNPVGQFGWLEGRTGVPLYHTLAKLLIKQAV
ncbi:MAG: MvdC/MvdD family ATP grasp protein [Ktedonobacteraceae bacterium]